MRQLVLSGNYRRESLVTLSAAETHYLRNVLRLNAGDRLPVLTADRRRYTAVIRRYTAAGAEIFLGAGEASREEEGKCRPQLSLFQCLPKGSKMDLIVRQAAEAGVRKIQPVISGRTVTRPESGRVEKRMLRWKKIIKEALQQSGSGIITEIGVPLPFYDLPRVFPPAPQRPFFFFHQSRLEQKGLHSYLESLPAEIGILVGPEGGFSEEETNFCLDAGLNPVYLGSNVLRTETAALYALASVQILILERDEWRHVK
jgi:16S rRNA (uracil1498-N3)-methyltransferase